MNGAAKFSFTFDVHNPTCTNAGCRRNSHGMPEAILPKISHGQAVDLADTSAPGVYYQHISLDRIDDS